MSLYSKYVAEFSGKLFICFASFNEKQAVTPISFARIFVFIIFKLVQKKKVRLMGDPLF